MKFPIIVPCRTCGAEFATVGFDEKDFPPVFCPACKAAIFPQEPPSISVAATRLLLRSQTEIDGGDPTVSIICSAMAVEAAFAQTFIRWKKIEERVHQPDEKQLEEWEDEYKNRTRGRFEKSADFISNLLTRKTFEEFTAIFITKSELAGERLELKLSHICNSLFEKRNHIMHRGKIDHSKDDALGALAAAQNVIFILEAMDAERCEAMRNSFKPVLIQL